ncbi:MAG: hypothetical protein GDA56_11725 [Hormoscilla sp. GM7CHS1pb]|nr:hypothetical protein [Hormoscilla sp. GM7CHS1pb]
MYVHSLAVKQKSDVQHFLASRLEMLTAWEYMILWAHYSNSRQKRLVPMGLVIGKTLSSAD